MKNIIEAALMVATAFPVFPVTQAKRPSWSNAELGVGRGEGGYKIATTDPKRIKELFAHDRAEAIAVPMGEQSGLMCIDCDTYKFPELEQWLIDHKELFKTKCHVTQSGGRHYIYKHPGNMKFPAQLRPGVDIKAVGNGYILWPPSDGYQERGQWHGAAPFPMAIMDLLEKPETGPTGAPGDYVEDSVFIDNIVSAKDFHASMASVAWRLASRGEDHDTIVTTLMTLLDTSAARDPKHSRHADWLERNELDHIEDCAASAISKQAKGIDLTHYEKEAFSGPSLIPERPIPPSSLVAAVDIITATEARERNDAHIKDAIKKRDTPSRFTRITVQGVRKKTLPPIEWIVPGVIPARGLVSLAGQSGVGKTRWLAAFAAAAAGGNLVSVGLPVADKIAIVWVANEEACEDIERRIKATAILNGGKSSKVISVLGKENGTMSLIKMEDGHPLPNYEAAAELVAEIKAVEADLLMLDPYNTITGGAEENSAEVAAVLSKLLREIIELTGVAILHAHHTPKNRALQADWYRGSADAWRGSGAIFSGLDNAVTLSHWYPHKDSQAVGATLAQWKARYLSDNLKRWIIMDSAKEREGLPIAPVVYELVNQELPEGYGIGAARLSSETEAGQSISETNTTAAEQLQRAEAIISMMGKGTFTLNAVHKKMLTRPEWVTNGKDLKTASKDLLMMQFGHGFDATNGKVTIHAIGEGRGARYNVEIT